jgi:nucleosome binding factor SPN SPT16 subunit
MNFCKSTDGTLEMHVNGFRYVSQKEEIMDITFASVKHFIYQSPEEEIIAAIHLQLKGPIMVNKKRTSEVQFYREVPGALESLENKFKFRLTSMDIEFERGVKQERIDMIREFEEFISKVEDADGEFVVKFERPLRHMAYEGNWNRARLFLQPS